MKLKYLFAIAAIFSTTAAVALDVTTSEAGSLGSLTGGNTTITTLAITGPVNAYDFEYINGTLKSLTSLDLSHATITAASGAKTATGSSEFEADELPPYALFGTRLASVVLPENLIKIGEGALGNTPIASITIPPSVTTISNYAFTDCDKLTAITVPSTVTSLGAGVWKGCKSLEKATIYTQMEEIGASMFDGCTQLSEILLQPTFKSIGNSSFANCTSLNTFTFPGTLVSIGDKAFYASGLTSAHLDNSPALASIGDFAFAECKQLESVTMGSSTTAFGKGLFFDDTALRQVQLPASTTVIPAFTFKGTTSVDPETALPVSTKEINDFALYGWEQAESIVLPEGTEYIGTGAMEGWNSLRKLGAENLSSVPALGENVWNGINQGEVYLYVKSSTADDFRLADQWKDFKITIGSTGADEIINDVTGENGSANVDFTVGDGYLRVQSHGADIADIRIYDLNGRSRYMATVDTDALTVNTMQWRGSVLIVDVKLADGSRATVKLSI